MTEKPEFGRQTMLAIALMIGSVITFSIIDALAKVLVQDLPVIQVLWGRLVFFVAIACLFIPPARWRRVLATAKPQIQIGRALLPLSASGLSYIALKTMSLADVTAITFAAPFFIVALSVPLLGERVGRHRWTAVAIGFLGILVIIRPGTGLFGLVALLPLGSALLYACFQLITRFISAGAGTGPATTLLYTGLTGLLVTSPFVFFFWQPMTTAHWALMALSGCGHIASHFLLIQAYSRAQASLLSPFNFTKIFGALLLGYLIFGHVPDGMSIAGIVIVIGAGLYMVHRERVRARGG